MSTGSKQIYQKFKIRNVARKFFLYPSIFIFLFPYKEDRDSPTMYRGNNCNMLDKWVPGFYNSCNTSFVREANVKMNLCHNMSHSRRRTEIKTDYVRCKFSEGTRFHQDFSNNNSYFFNQICMQHISSDSLKDSSPISYINFFSTHFFFFSIQQFVDETFFSADQKISMWCIRTFKKILKIVWKSRYKRMPISNLLL